MNFEVLWLFAKVFSITGNIKLVVYIVQLAFLSLSLPLSLSLILSLLFSLPDIPRLPAIERKELFNVVFDTTAYRAPPNIQLPEDYQSPALAISKLYWKGWLLLLVLSAFNPKTIGTAFCWREMGGLEVGLDFQPFPFSFHPSSAPPSCSSIFLLFPPPLLPTFLFLLSPLLLSSSPPSSLLPGALGWSEYPTLRGMMEMAMTNTYTFPSSMTLVTSDSGSVESKDSAITRELQVCLLSVCLSARLSASMSHSLHSILVC